MFFFKDGHAAYQIIGDDEQNIMQVKCLSLGLTGDLEVRSKAQISLNFGYHINFKDFSTILCVCSLKQKIENKSYIIFIMLLGSFPRDGTYECWGSKTLTWGFAMAPNRLHVLVILKHFSHRH